MRTSFNTFGAILFACALRAAVAQTLSGDQATCMNKCISDTPIAPCAAGDIQCTCAPASSVRANILTCGTGTCGIPSADATSFYNATCVNSGFDPSKPASKTGSADIRGVWESTALVAVAVGLAVSTVFV
ncbi:hypothetical protein MVEN_00323200 [Mycena venus]|uniref:Extracellular membrane protein CFEM domain-containing protein n=1 Tax=Mycena venus TaxID=2733690 RepID=A0A8H7D9I8_9AGAR|nr:hypothetical protein MVEN_00323200 [Mycena venus]